MKHIFKAVVLSAAVALSLSTVLQARQSLQPAQQAAQPGSVEFFLVDPELGLAGAYNLNAETIYFEARRSDDADGGAFGSLEMRLVDAAGRTLALSGQHAKSSSTPAQGEFLVTEGFKYAHLLEGLGRALESTHLHTSLRAEKAALATLAMGAANTPAAGFPLRDESVAKGAAPVSAAEVADFYIDAVRNVAMARTSGDALRVDLADGMTLQIGQEFFPDELNEEGYFGRVGTNLMLTDADGYALAAELTGDAVPAGWRDALEKQTTRDHHELASEFGRAASALNALAYSAKAIPGASLSRADELDAMQRMAKASARDLLPGRDRDSQMAGFAIPKAAGIYRTSIQVWRTGVWGMPSWVGEHSATYVQLYKYNSASSQTYHRTGTRSFCNHGGCAYNGNMSRKCTYLGYRSSSYHIPSTTWSPSPGAASWHTCRTNYWLIGRSGYHNCNDDSYTQVQAVHGRSYSVYGGRCAYDWAKNAPTCD